MVKLIHKKTVALINDPCKDSVFKVPWVMLAQGVSYCHIYNKGVDGRIIFANEDYKIFEGFLKKYLTLWDPENSKTHFTVKGRNYRGIPHQPKNYFDKVELIAYCLKPDHFHLVLRQVVPGAVERFARSLFTSYSLYYNKKYNRSGTLFDGPYKVKPVKDLSSLLLLTHFLHKDANHSSYNDYLGDTNNGWVKPKSVLDYFENNKVDQTIKNYKEFVEGCELSKEQKENLTKVSIENLASHNTKQVQKVDSEKIHTLQTKYPTNRLPEFVMTSSPPLRAGFPSLKKDDISGSIHPRAYARGLLETVITTVIFLVLVFFGIRNIKLTTARNFEIANARKTQPVLGVKSSPTPTEDQNISPADTTENNTTIIMTPKTTLIIRIKDGSQSAPIYLTPSIQSEIIGSAKENDTFDEYVFVNSDWYSVILPDDQTGFLSAEYIKIQVVEESY